MKTELEEVENKPPLAFAIKYTVINEVVFEYKITTMDAIDVNNIKTFKEIEVPENMGEFRKYNNISSKELLKWLNKNYK